MLRNAINLDPIVEIFNELYESGEKATLKSDNKELVLECENYYEFKKLSDGKILLCRFGTNILESKNVETLIEVYKYQSSLKRLEEAEYAKSKTKNDE